MCKCTGECTEEARKCDFWKVKTPASPCPVSQIEESHRLLNTCEYMVLHGFISGKHSTLQVNSISMCSIYQLFQTTALPKTSTDNRVHTEHAMRQQNPLFQFCTHMHILMHSNRRQCNPSTGLHEYSGVRSLT